MEHNFDSGPGFWAMVENGPEMAQNEKKSNYSHIFKATKLIF